MDGWMDERRKERVLVVWLRAREGEQRQRAAAFFFSKTNKKEETLQNGQKRRLLYITEGCPFAPSLVLGL